MVQIATRRAMNTNKMSSCVMCTRSSASFSHPPHSINEEEDESTEKE